MLDTDTKRRIDTARDILVGRVPEHSPEIVTTPELSPNGRNGRLCTVVDYVKLRNGLR